MVREDLLYSDSHEWVKVDGDIAIIGITDYAQHELGDIVYVELPSEDDEVSQNESFGSVEAVKAVEDIISPVSGVVVAINENLADTPELINKSAFDEGWLIKVELSDKSELEGLMSADQYKEMIEG